MERFFYFFEKISPCCKPRGAKQRRILPLTTFRKVVVPQRLKAMEHLLLSDNRRFRKGIRGQDDTVGVHSINNTLN